jgi:thioredoxin-like negative regulator of GroEL
MMAFLLCAVPAGAQQAIPEAAKKHLLAGIEAIEKAKTQEDFDRAVGEFEAAAKIAPNAPEVYYFLGKTLSMTRGRTKQAIDAYNRYLALAPNAPDAAKVKAEIADLEKMRAWSRKSGSIGMAAVALPDGFYLRSVYPTSPAAAAGLRQGDKIVAVDGRPTKGLTLLQFSELLDGAPGSTCTMDVVRGTAPMKVSFKRTEPFGSKGLFQEIDGGDLGGEVTQSKIPVAVFFCTGYNTDCMTLNRMSMRMLGPYRGKVKFVNINVDETPELAKKLKITTIPTTLLYKNGDHVGTVTGPNMNELIQKLNVMLAEDAAPAQGASPGQDVQAPSGGGRGRR